MCAICTDWIKGSLTNKEALNNLKEAMYSGNNTEEELMHYFEIAEKVLEENKK
jgi:hypothetical protein